MSTEKDLETQKAIGQFRLQLGGVLEVFQCYGLQDFIPESIDEIVKLSLSLHQRLSGLDVPIVTNMSRERATK